MPEPAQIEASIVIASYNGRATLIPCLEHLAKQTFPMEQFEVIVVLDGSTDGSRVALGEISLPYTMKVIEQNNAGKPAAVNNGVRDARGRYLVIIDCDIMVNPEFLESHLAAHDRGDVVIGPIPLSEMSPISFLTDGVKNWADKHTREMSERTGVIRHTEMYGGNFSVLLSDYLRVGGYREELLRSDDYQLGKKFIEAGLKIVFERGAIGAQVFDKTVPALCNDFFVDGQCHVIMIREFPEVKKDLKAGRYYPMSLTKRILRPLVIYRNPLGSVITGCAQTVLEWTRRIGLRWKVLSSCQGVICDSMYFRGVYDSIGDKAEFKRFVSDG